MDEFYEDSEILVTFVHILSLLFIILVGTFTIDVLSVEEKVEMRVPLIFSFILGIKT